MLSTVPGRNNTRFSDVYLNVSRVSLKNSIEKMWFNLFCILKEYTNAKLRRSSLKLFQIYTIQLRKVSTFLTCISVLKPVNPCSCFGRAINDFGKLFSARLYNVTLEIQVCTEDQLQLLWFFNPLPLALLQSTSLAAILNFCQIQPGYS